MGRNGRDFRHASRHPAPLWAPFGSGHATTKGPRMPVTPLRGCGSETHTGAACTTVVVSRSLLAPGRCHSRWRRRAHPHTAARSQAATHGVRFGASTWHNDSQTCVRSSVESSGRPGTSRRTNPRHRARRVPCDQGRSPRVLSGSDTYTPAPELHRAGPGLVLARWHHPAWS